MGWIAFYSGNNGTRNVVQLLSDSRRPGFRPRQNDKIRSLKLLNVREGAVIRLFDDGRGPLRDDWCEIRVKRPANAYTVNTLERSYEDRFVSIVYHARDNLDGKVSYVEIL